ncbi:hypothetical protein MLD38_006779 [Melastoma candidum]|uniref:Uncharacterized protein n=1 Tax=Melastoma candidum TaxID=119954 RepID=A0ACB9RQV5_9MYRT|nr:hypothetical protein MLD38_006779 [Melastoma candidum]
MVIPLILRDHPAGGTSEATDTALPYWRWRRRRRFVRVPEISGRRETWRSGERGQAETRREAEVLILTGKPAIPSINEKGCSCCGASVRLIRWWLPAWESTVDRADCAICLERFQNREPFGASPLFPPVPRGMPDALDRVPSPTAPAAGRQFR